MRFKLVSSLAVLSLAAVGCDQGGPGADAIKEMERAPLATYEEAHAFGNYSPFSMYMSIQMFAAAAQDEEENPMGCPKVTVDGRVTRIEGGCTTGGSTITGSLVFTADEAGSKFGRLELDGFGVIEEEECNGEVVTNTMVMDGTSRVKGDNTRAEVELDVAVRTSEPDELCVLRSETIAYVFNGQVEGPIPSPVDGEQMATQDASTWNGTGQVGIAQFGYVDVETEDQVIHFGACALGALSGSNTFTGEKEAVITFRGAETCGSNATWTLDGVAQGEMRGVTCSAMGGGSLSAFGLLALGGLLLRRRRDAH